MFSLLRFVGIVSAVIIFLAASAFAAPPAKEFGRLPLIYDAAISPDGTKIAMFANLGGGYGLLVYNETDVGGDPIVVGLPEGVKPQWLKWANEDYILVSVWQNERIGTTPVTAGFLYSMNVETKKIKLLIKPKDILRQYNNDVIDFLEGDPDHILMSFSDDNARAPDVQKVKVATGGYSRVKKGRVSIQEWYTDLTGDVRVGQGRKDTGDGDWYLTIRESLTEKWLKGDDFPGLDADADIRGFTSNPDELIVGRRAGKDTVGLYVYDLSQKSFTRKLFHNEDYDAGGLVLSGDGKEVVGASYVADTPQIELFDQHGSALERLRQKHPAFTVKYIDQSKTGDEILVKLSHASEPGALYLLKGEAGNMSKVGTYRENLPMKDMGRVSVVRYTARDGEKIPAYVTLPPSITDNSQLKNLPFIVLPHGGPYARKQKNFDYFAQFFATRGYGVLQMNFRGSAGYGKKFKDAGRENWVVMQEDVEDGTRWLLDKGYADPKRTCIAGWSYGGYAALIGAIKNPDLYACSISMAGVTDLKDMINDMKKYRFGRISVQNFVLKGFENKDDLKENSPVKRAEELSMPVFIAHGKLDQRVHFDQFKRMKSALKKSSAKVTAIEFKDEDHFLSNEKNRIEFFEELEKFLEKSVGKSEYMTD